MVEYFTQRMVFREFFVQYLEKFTPDVCRYVSAIWGVVPDDSSRTVSSLLVGLVCNRQLVPQLIVVSTIIYTLLVYIYTYSSVSKERVCGKNKFGAHIDPCAPNLEVKDVLPRLPYLDLK